MRRVKRFFHLCRSFAGTLRPKSETRTPKSEPEIETRNPKSKPELQNRNWKPEVVTRNPKRGWDPNAYPCAAAMPRVRSTSLLLVLFIDLSRLFAES
jgi:hypothetical protein